MTTEKNRCVPIIRLVEKAVKKKERGTGELILQLVYAGAMLGGLIYFVQCLAIGVMAMTLFLFN